MKVVASRDFLNVGKLGFTNFTDASGSPITTHKNHVPKGARFDIGTSDIIGDLIPSDKDKLVWLLPSGGANCIVFAKDADTVKKIDKEVAEAKAHKEAAKAAVPPTISDVMGVVTKLMESNAKLIEALAGAKPVKT